MRLRTKIQYNIQALQTLPRLIWSCQILRWPKEEVESKLVIAAGDGWSHKQTTVTCKAIDTEALCLW